MILTLVLLGAVVGFATPSVETGTVRVAALKGPTGIGMARLLDTQPSFGTGLTWSYTVLPTPQEMVARVASGEVDIAVLPANTAAKLYTEGPRYRMGAIVGWGVLYLLSRDPAVTGWGDLRGREVLTVGKGATPDFLARYLLSRNGLDPEKDVRLNFSFSQEQVAQLLIAGRSDTAIVPEPFVTQILSRSPETQIVLDLQQEWRKALGAADAYPISVVVIRPGLIERAPLAVSRFLDAYEESIRWVNGDPAAAAVVVGRLDLMPEAVARLAIPRCNLDFVRGDEARETMETYLEVLMAFDATSVGSRLPDAEFYLSR